MHLKHATFEPKRTRLGRGGARRTKKKLIKILQDQKEVDQDFADQEERWDRWIKSARPRKSTDAQVGDAEGLFKSLWIIILQPQVNLSMRVSL